MKHLLRLGRRGTPLVVGCGLAIAVHVLGLSLLPGGRSGQDLPEPLESRDNTPELLQWSSQPAPLPNLEVLPLPRSAVLPPPPVGLRTRKGAPGRGAPANRAQGLGPGGSSLAQTPRSGAGGGRRQGATHPSGKPQVDRPLDGGDDWAMALNQLQAFVDRDALRSDSNADTVTEPSTGDQEEGGTPGRLALESPAREAYQALWRQARPHRLPPLPPPVAGTRGAREVRQVSLGQVRAAAVPIRHGEVVVLPGEVLLVWLHGEKIFLLRSALPSQRSR